MTKKEIAMYEKWLNAEHASVFEAYVRPSRTKMYVEQSIIDEMGALNGYGYRVTSYNTFNFACAFIYWRDDVERMVYYTHANRYDFEIRGIYENVNE